MEQVASSKSERCWDAQGVLHICHAEPWRFHRCRRGLSGLKAANLWSNLYFRASTTWSLLERLAKWGGFWLKALNTPLTYPLLNVLDQNLYPYHAGGKELYPATLLEETASTQYAIHFCRTCLGICACISMCMCMCTRRCMCTCMCVSMYTFMYV